MATSSFQIWVTDSRRPLRPKYSVIFTFASFPFFLPLTFSPSFHPPAFSLPFSFLWSQSSVSSLLRKEVHKRTCWFFHWEKKQQRCFHGTPALSLSTHFLLKWEGCFKISFVRLFTRVQEVCRMSLWWLKCRAHRQENRSSKFLSHNDKYVGGKAERLLFKRTDGSRAENGPCS